MTTTTQQTPSNPALDFANAIREETDNGLELIEILHDIAQGNDPKATANDRITAANILADRGFGKCPRQIDPNPAPTPKSDANDVGAIRESPSVPAANPRPVTQIKDSLDQALGPAPTTHSPQSTNHYSQSTIHFTIQQHIIEITNNGQTIRDTLKEIARAKDDPKVTPYHRARAARILLDRLLGTDSALEKRTKPYVRPVRHIDPDDLAEFRAKLQRMEDEGTLTPYPDGRRDNITVPEIPEWFDPTPYLDEASEKFEADIKMRLERQKAWPAIEERRRKKLAKIYPSHSEDGKPPDP